jgi:hypothetical protein
MRSSSSLSPVPGSPELPLNSSQLSSFGPLRRCTQKPPSLPNTNAYIITHSLYRRTLLLTKPPSVQYTCSQPKCVYHYTYPTTKVTSTGNLIKHYDSRHKGIPTTEKEASEQRRAIENGQQFFKKPYRVLTQEEFRKLLLEFIICNNLALRICKSLSFQALIEALQP